MTEQKNELDVLNTLMYALWDFDFKFIFPPSFVNILYMFGDIQHHSSKIYDSFLPNSACIISAFCMFYVQWGDERSMMQHYSKTFGQGPQIIHPVWTLMT